MLFVPIKFKTTVQLTPAELDSKYQERIYEKLRTVYEGTCTKYGFIKPKSIEIVKRSCGNFVKQNFNGAIRFDMICRAEVCNPIQGSIVIGVIKNKNQLGILAESSMELDNEKVPILDIIIPIKSAGIISQVSLDTLSIGDTITIEVLGKKYQMKDTKISIIGRVITPTKIDTVEELEEDFVEDNEQDNEDDIHATAVQLLEEDDEDDEKIKKVVIEDDEDEEEEEEEEGEEVFEEEEEEDEEDFEEEVVGGGDEY